MAAVSAPNSGDRTPKLAASCDSSKLDLSPVEGFLLSRIDGVTSWSLLREIGGLGPDEVDERLERWSDEGLIEFADPKAAAARRRRVRKTLPEGEIDEGELDESLDIEIDVQRRILEFESKLGNSYHDLLGVGMKAETKDIKKAYFKLSKEFHPDKYFRKEIGSYAKRLEVAFKRVLEAYELLSDSTVRAEIEKSMLAAAQAAGPQSLQGRPAGSPPRELTKLERLRARMPYKLPDSFLAGRQQRASDFFEAAQRDVATNEFIEAAQTIRLAIAFDPFNEVYRDAFGIVQARAAEMRAEALTAQADKAAAGVVIDDKHFAQILKLYEEALLYRPHQPDLNDRAARAALECRQVPKAVEYVERAIAHSPDVALHHVTMAMVHQARGNMGHGINELERALELEPSNEEACRLLAKMRRSSKLA
jgi:tetratricopeptide (TPR) repeat protein